MPPDQKFSPSPRHAAPQVARISVETLREVRRLTDPALHPDRREEAERVSANLDYLIRAAEESAWPL